MKTWIALVLAAGLWLSCSNDDSAGSNNPVNPYVPGSPLDTTLTFVTLNMAVGFDAERMLSKDLSVPSNVLTEGKALYDEMQRSRPNARITALADSLARLAPDVIALQEVLYLENRQDSQTVDFLSLLCSAMVQLGAPSYDVVKQVLNPLTINVTDTAAHDSVDIFFYEGNAVLYKTSALTLLASDSIKYFFGIKNLKYLAGTMEIRRGAVFAKFSTTKGTVLNVFNTHLEVEAIPTVGSSQVMELQNYLGAKAPPAEAAMVLGDFNDAPGGFRVRTLKEQGFTETYNGTEGNTCCFDITNTEIPMTRKIDYIFARNIVKIEESAVRFAGTFAADSSNYRISDHAGVMAGLTFH